MEHFSYNKLVRDQELRERIKTELTKVFCKPSVIQEKELFKLIDQLHIHRKKSDAIILDILLWAIKKNGLMKDHMLLLSKYLGKTRNRTDKFHERLKNLDEIEI